jgi:hypothetical protein
VKGWYLNCLLLDVARAYRYNEPTVIWRLRHLDGRTAHAVIVPNGRKALAVWFMSGAPQKIRDFRTWRVAIDWLEDARSILETSGWSWWERPKPGVSRLDAEVM